MSVTIVRKKFEDLDFTPLYGSIDVKGDLKSWSVELPVEQAVAMEKDGFDIGWVHSTEPYEKALNQIKTIAERFTK